MLIKLGQVQRGAHLGGEERDLGGVERGEERPEYDRDAVSGLPYARAGPDVPIESKLHAPGPRREWVERPALIEYLAASTARLVLVDAPAGFGKTTLVAQWRSAAGEERPFAWISLDPGDDDPGRLWWYIVCALQRACPEIGGEDIARELRAAVPDITGTVLPLLANELGALSAPVVLVLDDYHVIKERSCHDQVAFLLLHLPPSAQIVLITRADPPLPLARLRAAGEMVEIRARELRFGAQEAAALVHDVSGVALSYADVVDLVERTEGWPAGLYLAALSLRGHPSPGAFVRQFTGDNRFVVDFLADEVLGRQPERDPAVPGADLHPQPAVRPAVRRGDRLGQRRRDHRGPRAGEPVPRAAGRQSAVVPVPPSVRPIAPQPARQDRARAHARVARAGERLAPPVRVGRGGDHSRARGRRRQRGR